MTSFPILDLASPPDVAGGDAVGDVMAAPMMAARAAVEVSAAAVPVEEAVPVEAAVPVPVVGRPDGHRVRRGRRVLACVLLGALLPVAAFLAFVAVQVLGGLGSGAAGGCGGG